MHLISVWDMIMSFVYQIFFFLYMLSFSRLTCLAIEVCFSFKLLLLSLVLWGYMEQQEQHFLLSTDGCSGSRCFLCRFHIILCLLSPLRHRNNPSAGVVFISYKDNPRARIILKYFEPLNRRCFGQISRGMTIAVFVLSIFTKALSKYTNYCIL